MRNIGTNRRVPSRFGAFTMAGAAAALLLPAGASASLLRTLVCELRGGQEVPVNNSPARGCGVFRLDPVANTLSYYIVFSGLTSAETAAHIHGASLPGVNSGVLHTLPAGNPKIGVWNFPAAMLNDIIQGRMYVNIHTNNFPGGEIRGQIGHFVAVINPQQEVPPTPTTGSAWATCWIDTAANQLNYHIAIESLNAGSVETAAHFHGMVLHGANAGVVHGLPLGAVKRGTWNYAEAQERDILDGKTYINIHTNAFAGGEIRGQVVSTVVPIDGMQETPPVVTPATGCGFVALDRTTDTLSLFMQHMNITTETAAHIHGFAPRGVAAGVLVGLPAGNPKMLTWNFGAANANPVLNGRTYINVHTSANPGGEIRGQIEFAQGKPPPCPGDADGDGDVDQADLGILLANFGTNVPPGTNGDLDGDGDVDQADLGILLAAFGQPCP